MKAPVFVTKDTYDFGVARPADLKLVKGAYSSDLKAIEEALHEGADVNVVSGNGFTPLIWVAFQCRVGDDPLGSAKCLIDHGADVNYVASCAATPLSMVCDVGHLRLAKMLISRGAQTNTPSDAESPLHIAVAANDWRLVKLLLEHGADRTRRDHMGRTAFDIAREHRNKKTLNIPQ